MLRIRTVGLCLLAAVAFSALAASSASASSFLAHPTGKVTDVNTNTHKFKTNGGTVECTKETSEGTVTALKALTNIEKVKYTGCTAFGLGATITEAEYEFSADLKVTVLNDITITVTGCKVFVLGAANKDLNSVHYSNSGNDLKINAKVTGITYETTGGICGAGGTNGEYNGESIAGLSGGGALRWDKE
jgi:hypothetical protein